MTTSSSMNRIFTPTVTVVVSLYGMLCTMYHRMQSSNLLHRHGTWSRNFATCPCAVDMPADSAELRGKTHKLDYYWHFFSEVKGYFTGRNFKPLTVW